MATWTVERPTRISFDGEVKRLSVHLVGSRLSVVGTSGPPRIEVTAIGSRAVTVRLGEDGTLSVAHENVPQWWGLLWAFRHRQFRADVSIAVPHETVAALRVVSGSVVVSTLRAGVTVDVTSGRITLMGLDGTILAKAVSGSIEALSLAGDLTLRTISGEITLADSTARRVRAQAVSGSLTCDLDNPPLDSEIRLETTSGEITARVREDSDLRVSMHATGGRVTSAFPELRALGVRSVDGQLGGGRGQLYVNAISGNINLLRRPVGRDAEDVR